VPLQRDLQPFLLPLQSQGGASLVGDAVGFGVGKMHEHTNGTGLLEGEFVAGIGGGVGAGVAFFFGSFLIYCSLFLLSSSTRLVLSVSFPLKRMRRLLEHVHWLKSETEQLPLPSEHTPANEFVGAAVGLREGCNVGLSVGEDVGLSVGGVVAEGFVGAAVGLREGCDVGLPVGEDVGLSVGGVVALVGALVGLEVGDGATTLTRATCASQSRLAGKLHMTLGFIKLLPDATSMKLCALPGTT